MRAVSPVRRGPPPPPQVLFIGLLPGLTGGSRPAEQKQGPLGAEAFRERSAHPAPSIYWTQIESEPPRVTRSPRLHVMESERILRGLVWSAEGLSAARRACG